jgi:hypothetical protein
VNKPGRITFKATLKWNIFLSKGNIFRGAYCFSTMKIFYHHFKTSFHWWKFFEVRSMNWSASALMTKCNYVLKWWWEIFIIQTQKMFRDSMSIPQEESYAIWSRNGYVNTCSTSNCGAFGGTGERKSCRIANVTFSLFNSLLSFCLFFYQKLSILSPIWKSEMAT